LPLFTHADPKHEAAVGLAEALVLDGTSSQPWPVSSVDALLEDGVIMIPNVLSSATVASLRAWLESKLDESRVLVASGDAASENNLLNRVCCPQDRYFLALGLEPQVVVDAVAEALQVLSPFIRGVLKHNKEDIVDEPLITNLGAVCTTEGAPRQPVHADDDRLYSSCPERLVAFVALQDIDEQMGPTTFLPGTHSSVQAHNALVSPTKKAKLLRTGPVRSGTMPAGSCTLHDAGLLHAGGGNSSSRNRWLFQMSFARAGLQLSCPHIYKSMISNGVHTLEELKRGAIRSKDDEETTRLQAMWLALLEDEEVKGMFKQYQMDLVEYNMSHYDIDLWWTHVRSKFESAVGMK